MEGCESCHERVNELKGSGVQGRGMTYQLLGRAIGCSECTAAPILVDRAAGHDGERSSMEMRGFAHDKDPACLRADIPIG